MKKTALLFLLAVMVPAGIYAAERMIAFGQNGSGYSLIADGRPACIVVSPGENEGVVMAVNSLAADFERVCGTKAAVRATVPAAGNAIMAGGMSTPAIRAALTNAQRKALKGKWEKYIITAATVSGREVVLIAGSDRRGTIFGIYELSKQLGVSPWYWWADVPTTRCDNASFIRGEYTDGEPAVQYRGIFINDEWPCFGNWTHSKFGGFKSAMYERLFELILRLKGNYMWPAMWSGAFFDDDKENGPLANRMGIVVGTSHHEPMQLNQQDWKRRGRGAWNYTTNAEELRTFWRGGIERAKDWEKVVTIGMRGDGDEPMSEGTNIKLMEQIVKDQRQIIADVTGRPAAETPQLWALYKEVQDYYDKGMTVPDDVTLLLCDDNWGNVRRLPALDSKPRKGGYGMYYHFDYVGAPRNSKWLNINNTARVWEQLRLTYAYNVRKLWIVNVGDLKLQEYPIQFFMDLAWNPEAVGASDVQRHTRSFYEGIFGGHGDEIARIMTSFAKLNRAVTPETLDASIFSFSYDEWPRMVSKWSDMESRAAKIRAAVPQAALDAYDQLVEIPVEACANLYRMYYAQAMNKRLAAKKSSEANAWAAEVERLFANDSLIAQRYHALNDGKWNHFMSQMHIGYTSWNDSKHNVMPKVEYVNDGSGNRLKANGEAIYPQIKEVAAPEKGSYIFAEKDRHVAIEAAHTTRRTDGAAARWLEIPDFGKTLSGMTTWPQTAVPDSGMSLEYDIDFAAEGDAHLILMFAPTLNYNDYKGLRYSVQLGSQPAKTVNINSQYRGELGQWQRNPIIESRTVVKTTAGRSTLRVRLLDPGMALEKIVIDRGGAGKSYLGPLETIK